MLSSPLPQLMEHRQFDPLCSKPNWKLEQLGSFRVLLTLAASGVGLSVSELARLPGHLFGCNGATMLYRLVRGSFRLCFMPCLSWV